MEAGELEALLNKVGGKYKLVTLFQKRMRELQRGLPKLVQSDTANLWDVVSKEINENKVDLMMGEEAERMRKDIATREAEELAEAELRTAEKGKLPKQPDESKEAKEAKEAAKEAK
jgi:DNA-directed RNA polymerase subunit K/omega